MKKGFFLIGLSLAFSYKVYSQEIKSVNFVQEGEVSKLIIETDQENTLAERFHVSEDKQIILDLKNVKVSPKLLRGIDTSEFPGSTVFISGYRKPGTKSDVRFAIQLRDNVRSIVENRGKNVVLNIENRFGVFSSNKIKSSESTSRAGTSDKVEDAVGLNVPKSNSIEDILANLTLAGPKKYIGKRISINVREIPVPDLLNMIADTSGFNIIIDQEVSKSPPLTLTLTNVPWDQALDTVLGLSKLVAEKNSNILVVKSFSTATKEAQEKIAAEKLREDLEPVVTRVFLINYASLIDIEKIIKSYITKELGTIQIDERTNSLIISDTADAIERIKKIVETLDTQTPQVLIEAKIIEANESYAKRIGLARGVSFGYDPIVNTGGITPTGPGFSFSSAPTTASPNTLGMTIGIYKRLLNLDLNLQLMESESKGRIISTPKVVTQNKRPASITSALTTSFPTFSQSTVATQTSAQSVTADLKLTVTPQITNDGSISMAIEVQKDSFGAKPFPQAPPDTTRRNIKTNVLVENGSTLVIGGLYQSSHTEAHSGVPFLKDLPLIGWLFRTPHAPDSQKNELVVFMTPRILNQDEAGLGDKQAAKATSSNPDI